MVPTTRFADLNLIDPELSMFSRHRGQIRLGAQPSGVGAEFVAIRIVQCGEIAL